MALPQDGYYSMEEQIWDTRQRLKEMARMMEDQQRLSVQPIFKPGLIANVSPYSMKLIALQAPEIHKMYVDESYAVAYEDNVSRETDNSLYNTIYDRTTAVKWIDGRASGGMWKPPTDKKAELEKERKRKIHALWAQRHMKSKAT